VFVVDTNILVYAADRSSPFHARCLEALESWRSQAGAWFLTWNVVYEFLRVTTHPRVMRRPWSIEEAWSFIKAVQASPGLAMLLPTERHARVLGEVVGLLPWLSGNLLHDAHTATLMREHGIRRIYTRDTDFHRFSFLEPLDPTAGPS
jgi:toxin-antitoxin system PIN domain toxin